MFECSKEVKTFSLEEHLFLYFCIQGEIFLTIQSATKLPIDDQSSQDGAWFCSLAAEELDAAARGWPDPSLEANKGVSTWARHSWRGQEGRLNSENEVVLADAVPTGRMCMPRAPVHVCSHGFEM